MFWHMLTPPCNLRGLSKKYREFWISAGYVYSIFDFFVALCWCSYPSLITTSSVILNVRLIFDSYFAWTCFGSSSICASSVSGTRKVTVGQIRGMRWLQQHYCVGFGQKFENLNRAVESNFICVLSNCDNEEWRLVLSYQLYTLNIFDRERERERERRERNDNRIRRTPSHSSLYRGYACRGVTSHLLPLFKILHLHYLM